MPTLTKSTKSLSAKSLVVNWHLVDAKDKVLGRVATEIASKLIGKHKVGQVDYLDCGDEVVVINANKVVLTGKKLSDKIYTSFSGYPGGLKSIPAERMMTEKPDTVLLRAVSGMLPKNKLRATRLKRLHIFKEDVHQYSDKFN